MYKVQWIQLSNPKPVLKATHNSYTWQYYQLDAYKTAGCTDELAPLNLWRHIAIIYSERSMSTFILSILSIAAGNNNYVSKGSNLLWGPDCSDWERLWFSSTSPDEWRDSATKSRLWPRVLPSFSFNRVSSCLITTWCKTITTVDTGFINRLRSIHSSVYNSSGSLSEMGEVLQYLLTACNLSQLIPSILGRQLVEILCRPIRALCHYALCDRAITAFSERLLCLSVELMDTQGAVLKLVSHSCETRLPLSRHIISFLHINFSIVNCTWECLKDVSNSSGLSQTDTV
jgi:hypothetical protein